MLIEEVLLTEISNPILHITFEHLSLYMYTEAFCCPRVSSPFEPGQGHEDHWQGRLRSADLPNLVYLSIFAYLPIFVHFIYLPIGLFALLKFSSAISQDCPKGYHIGLELPPPSAPPSPISMAYQRDVTEIRQDRGTIRY